MRSPDVSESLANVDRESPTCSCCSLPATHYLDGDAATPVCWNEECERRLRAAAELL